MYFTYFVNFPFPKCALMLLKLKSNCFTFRQSYFSVIVNNKISQHQVNYFNYLVIKFFFFLFFFNKSKLNCRPTCFNLFTDLWNLQVIYKHKGVLVRIWMNRGNKKSWNNEDDHKSVVNFLLHSLTKIFFCFFVSVDE